jgi:predicted nucleic acid-binding protein
VELAPVVVAGLLHVVRPDDVELATFIDISLDLEDGEALTIALAVHRGWLVATDDRKAQRIAHERGVLLLTTLDLVKAWSERKCISPGDLHAALMALRERARYAPGRTHALYAWWEAAISLAE